MPKLVTMKRIVLLGAGHVAYHLVRGLAHSEDYTISQVYSRRRSRAEDLTAMLPQRPQAIDHIEDLDRSADIYLYALSDNALIPVWRTMPRTEGIWIHTAGSVSLEAVQMYHRRSAVLYPLQTFTRGTQVTWAEVPIFVEGGDEECLSMCRQLAQHLSQRVTEATSAHRGYLHLAAVFACNFTNHLIALAQKLLDHEGLDGTVLIPLVQETLSKLHSMPAFTAQTGPAVRGDQVTMQRHLTLLADKPQLAEMYRQISQSIADAHETNLRI